jgi:hypothetical protein
MRRRATGAALAILAGLVLVAPAPAGATAGSTGLHYVDEDEAAGFARQRGISIEEATERLRWQGAAPDMSEAIARDLGSRSGGVWIDNHDGDRVKVGVVGEPDPQVVEAVRQAAETVGLPDTGYDLVPVRHPLTTLEADNHWLGFEIARVNDGAPATLTAGLRTDLNAVELSTPQVGTLTPAQRELVDLAQRRLGVRLVLGSYAGRLEARACGSAYCGKPLRGGVRITMDVIGENPGCTAGFVARSKVDEKLYLFTAGHCGSVAGGLMWQTQTYDGTGWDHDIGKTWHWYWGSQGDMAIVRIDAAFLWDPQPWVNVTSGPDTTENETYHIASDKTSVIGMRICTTGSYWGNSDCGFVTQVGMTGTYDGVTVHNLGRGSFCGTQGDSGAPMYAQHVAFGLQVAGFAPCDSVYQGIKAAETKLNVNVLH